MISSRTPGLPSGRPICWGGDEGLGDARPIDLIKGNEADVDRVIRFAGTLDD